MMVGIIWNKGTIKLEHGNMGANNLEQQLREHLLEVSTQDIDTWELKEGTGGN